MLAMRNHEELPGRVPLDHTGERAGLAPGAQWAYGNPLAAEAIGTHLDEEVTLLRPGSGDELQETAVLRQTQIRKSPPLESADAQNETRGETPAEELQAEPLSRLASCENEDHVRHSEG
jgi:hypothetical protein